MRVRFRLSPDWTGGYRKEEEEEEEEELQGPHTHMGEKIFPIPGEGKKKIQRLENLEEEERRISSAASRNL